MNALVTVQSRAASSLISCEEFFDLVLADEGYSCVATLDPADGGRMRQYFGKGAAWAAAMAARLDVAPLQVFFACSNFLSDKSRKGDNAAASRAFWIDLDVEPPIPDPDKPKPYKTAREAMVALAGFEVELGLPRALVVRSGYGLHAYWPMTEDVTPSAWKLTATILKAAALKQGLKADPTRTADIASVLRPVGSTHRKGEPKEVIAVRVGLPSDPDDFRAALQAFLGTDLAEAADIFLARPPGIPRGMNSDLSADMEYPAAFADRIADECYVMDLIRHTRGKVDQPTWYHGLQLLNRCEDGQEVAHEWSKGDPRYTAAEVNKTLARLGSTGPTLCSKFGEHQPALCAKCVHVGKIKSPITLGVAPLPVIAATADRSAARADRFTMADIPHEMSEAVAGAVLNLHFEYVHDHHGQPTIIHHGAGGHFRLLTPKDLKDMLSNRRVIAAGPDGGVKCTPASDWWMRSRTRPEYDTALYDPEGKLGQFGQTVLNLFRGLRKSPRTGDWSLMNIHLLHVVCRSDISAYRYLIRWLAHLVQYPGTAPGTVIVLRSPKQGTGKSTIAVWFHAIFGQHALLLNSPEQLLGRFGEHLDGVSFICVNEPSFPGDHAASRKFNALITESEWPIEPKGRKLYRIPNVAHIMLTTNADWAVPAGSGARRWVVLDLDEGRVGDAAYFGDLYRQANNGGIEAMLHDLMMVDLTHFDARQIPVTAALIHQQQLSADPVVQWALDLADEGGSVFGRHTSTGDLHALYLEWMHDAGNRRAMSKATLGKWLRSTGLQPAQVGPANARTNGWVLPSPKIFHAKVELAAGIRTGDM
jgi:hypothetical protein